jgi:DNA-binding transcriptional MerR regulator
MELPDPDLLVIGRFARLVGLSVGALRHYDELDILRPAWVDPENGYRSYRRGQLETARVIARLRDLEVPLDGIRAYLGTDDPAERRRLLIDHRKRIEARTFRLQYVLHAVGRLAADPADATHSTDPTGPKEVTTMTTPTTDALTDLDAATHRALGVTLYNHVWTLLETADRTPAQIDEMIHAAHASRFHWSRAEGCEPVNLARGEWQCSRVYAVLGRAEPALWHAARCLAINEANGSADWDIASAYEAMARATSVAGDAAATADWKARATAALDGVADQDDRDIIEGDLKTLP